MIDRLEATRLLCARLDEQLVVSGLGNAAFDLYAACDRVLNFYTWGAMGTALPIGLGLALAQPERRVLVVEGDGSLLMNLGALATVGRYAPANLACLVWDNARFLITGGQPTATLDRTDLAAVARGCGIGRAEAVADLDAFRCALDRLLAGPGPALLVARVDSRASQGALPRRPVLIKYRFMQALGTLPDGSFWDR